MEWYQDCHLTSPCSALLQPARWGYPPVRRLSHRVGSRFASASAASEFCIQSPYSNWDQERSNREGAPGHCVCVQKFEKYILSVMWRQIISLKKKSLRTAFGMLRQGFSGCYCVFKATISRSATRKVPSCSSRIRSAVHISEKRCLQRTWTLMSLKITLRTCEVLRLG